MSSNLLSLDQSKTEFLINLPAQIATISDLSLLMPSNVIIKQVLSARNLDSTLLMSHHNRRFLNLVSCLFVTFEAEETLFIILLLTLLAHLSFTQNLIIATPSLWNLPHSQLGLRQLKFYSSSRFSKS